MGSPSSASRASADTPRRGRRSAEEIAERILDAAAQEFEASGYPGATTAAIARRAGVTEAQIFRIHANKQDLFRAAIFQPLNRHFADFQQRHAAAAQSEAPRAVARAYIAELQDFVAAHARMFLSLVAASAYSPGAAGSIGELEGLQAYFEQGRAMMAGRLGDRPPRVEPKLMVRVSFAAVLANLMFKDWLFPPGLARDEQVREAIIDFVIDGIQANAVAPP